MEISDLFEAIKGLGIAGGPVFGFFWWLEYRRSEKLTKDNIALNKELLLRAERYVDATSSQTSAINDVTRTVANAQETLQNMTVLMTEMASTLHTVVRRRGRSAADG